MMKHLASNQSLKHKKSIMISLLGIGKCKLKQLVISYLNGVLFLCKCIYREKPNKYFQIFTSIYRELFTGLFLNTGESQLRLI